jgi:hypothetical protein
MPLFGRMKRVDLDNSSQPDSQNQPINSTRSLPAYDNSLIGALESDHEEIIVLYNQVLKTARNRDYSVLQRMLGEFATLFTNHIQMEDERLYGYLKTLASKKSQVEQRVVAGFCSEMKNISITIFSSVSQSPNIPVNDKNVDDFIKEFSEVGFTLQDRIEREESILYPIYENSRKVVDIS